MDEGLHWQSLADTWKRTSEIPYLSDNCLSENFETIFWNDCADFFYHIMWSCFYKPV